MRAAISARTSLPPYWHGPKAVKCDRARKRPQSCETDESISKSAGVADHKDQRPSRYVNWLSGSVRCL